MGTTGLGVFNVSGLSRVPKPPAKSTAFICRNDTLRPYRFVLQVRVTIVHGRTLQ